MFTMQSYDILKELTKNMSKMITFKALFIDISQENCVKT